MNISTVDWRVKPLVLIVKLWAQFHKINSARNNTLSSYSLALMVISFLQCMYTIVMFRFSASILKISMLTFYRWCQSSNSAELAVPYKLFSKLLS